MDNQNTNTAPNPQVSVSTAQHADFEAYTQQRLATLIPMLQKIALGDFSVKFEIPTKEDGLTELTTALSLMLDDLREYQKTQTELQKQLQSKVAEFEKFNKLMVNRELKMVELKNENTSLREQLKQLKSQE